MIALTQQSLLDEAVKTLNVLLVNNLGENSERICLDHVVVGLLDILAEAGDDDEHFVLIDLELLDEHVDQAAKILVLLWSHLEKLCHIEEH